MDWHVWALVSLEQMIEEPRELARESAPAVWMERPLLVVSFPVLLPAQVRFPARVKQVPSLPPVSLEAIVSESRNFLHAAHIKKPA